MIPLFKSSLNPGSRLLFRASQTYVRQSQIDQICVGYGDGWKDKIMMYTKMFAHIGKEGFFGAKRDFKLFRQLRNKPKSERTQEDWNNIIRMRHDFYRLFPLWIIQILPMSGPLFILYMYTYPGSIPSWFLVDRFHQEYELSIRQSQRQAVAYFKDRNIKSSQIDFDKMSLEEARKLGLCLYGYYRDGTIGYKKLFKKPKEYVISEGFSKYLIKRKFRYKFNSDLLHEDILKNMDFNEKLRWKFEQVVEKGEMMVKYEDSLSPEELKARKQYANTLQNKNGQENTNANANVNKQEKQNK